ncbi:MAG: TIGR02300 family protein [Rhodospirillaceae bacterium]
MANPELGIKRICQACGTRYYDLNKSPIVCPECGATFDPEAILKSRRGRVVSDDKPVVPERPEAAEDKGAEDSDFEEADDEDIDGADDPLLDDDGDEANIEEEGVVAVIDEDETNT